MRPLPIVLNLLLLAALLVAADCAVFVPGGHVVFALLAALPVVRLPGRRPLRILAVGYPVFVAALVVATGHHPWLDVVAGAAIVALAAGMVALAQWRPARTREPMAALRP